MTLNLTSHFVLRMFSRKLKKGVSLENIKSLVFSRRIMADFRLWPLSSVKDTEKSGPSDSSMLMLLLVSGTRRIRGLAVGSLLVWMAFLISPRKGPRGEQLK